MTPSPRSNKLIKRQSVDSGIHLDSGLTTSASSSPTSSLTNINTKNNNANCTKSNYTSENHKLSR